MADKYPELDVQADEQDFDGDFLSREKELVGDEFKTEGDIDVLAESEDDEIQEFKEQFPDVSEANEQVAIEADEYDDEDEFEGFGSAPPVSKDVGESEPLKAWKERRDLEIEEREKANARKKEELISLAQQNIDDFYDNYNSKREQHTKDVEEEQKAFLAKRDDFLKHGTLWDRVNELVDGVGELQDDGRDKSRFTELLSKLKGKENAPGAAGY